jgi:hypothetical protein
MPLPCVTHEMFSIVPAVAQLWFEPDMSSTQLNVQTQL